MFTPCLGLRTARTRTACIALVCLACALGGCASAARRPRVMVDAQGMTVYTFDNDVRGSAYSTCSGSCARQWLPVPAEEMPSGDYGTVVREDGSRQLSYRGRPLYRYWKDEKPGDRLGDRYLGVWHIVPLDGYYYNPYEIPWRRLGC